MTTYEQTPLFSNTSAAQNEKDTPLTCKVQYGDIWQLGVHKLLCSDCRTHDEIAFLMQGETAKLALHDPPYGLRSRMAFGFGDGKMGGVARRGNFSPVYDDDKTFDPQHLLTSGSVVIIWGANHFADKLPASPAWILWDKRVDLPSNDMSDGEAAWVSIGNTLRIIHHKWNGFDRASERGIPRVHPTQKPIEVQSQIIRKYTHENELVTDWYAGSGTTLIAAETTKRRAYVCEIEPHYCNVILSRYEKATGKTATLIHRTASQ